MTESGMSPKNSPEMRVLSMSLLRDMKQTTEAAAEMMNNANTGCCRGNLMSNQPELEKDEQ